MPILQYPGPFFLHPPTVFLQPTVCSPHSAARTVPSLRARPAACAASSTLTTAANRTLITSRNRECSHNIHKVASRFSVTIAKNLITVFTQPFTIFRCYSLQNISPMLIETRIRRNLSVPGFTVLFKIACHQPDRPPQSSASAAAGRPSSSE